MEPPNQGVFNLTLTYARSAHVPWTYGSRELLSHTVDTNCNNTFNFDANKKHLCSVCVFRATTAAVAEWLRAGGVGHHDHF